MRDETFLLPDPALPPVAAAWSAEVVDAIARLAPAGAAAGVRIRDMRYSPGRTLVVLYEPEAPDGSPFPWTVASFATAGRLRRRVARADPRSSELVLRGRCLVERFPADTQLPALSAAVSLADPAPLLARLGANGSRAAEVDVLHYRPHRQCVLEYRLHGAGGVSRVAVGKAYPTRGAADAAAATLRAVHAAAPSGVGVPEPLGMVAPWRLVLMSRERGTAAGPLLAQPGSAAEDAAAGAGAALAVLHRLPVPAAPLRTVVTELEHLRARSAGLRLVAPLLAARVDELLDLVAARGLRPTGPETFVHGDYTASQLLVDAGRVTVLDFDRAARGDAAVDVGTFLAGLHKLSPPADALSRAFLAQYVARSGERSLVDRARVMESLALVRLATRRFRAAPHVFAREGPAFVSFRYLDRAAACLAGVGSA